jgi:hypothetical protein
MRVIEAQPDVGTLFASMDTDGDGVVSSREFMGSDAGTPRNPALARLARVRAVMNTIDAAAPPEDVPPPWPGGADPDPDPEPEPEPEQVRRLSSSTGLSLVSADSEVFSKRPGARAEEIARFAAGGPLPAVANPLAGTEHFQRQQAGAQSLGLVDSTAWPRAPRADGISKGQRMRARMVDKHGDKARMAAGISPPVSPTASGGGASLDADARRSWPFLTPSLGTQQEVTAAAAAAAESRAGTWRLCVRAWPRCRAIARGPRR